MNYNIVSAFENYKEATFNANTDLNFWSSFITNAIECYQNKEGIPEIIYQAGFCAYDINVELNKGFLKGHNETRNIKTADLVAHREQFFSWIRNLVILKSYNALEILILQGIWLNHYPELKNPTNNKNASDSLQSKIKKQLEISGLQCDTRNNRHIIEFLKNKHDVYSKFLQKEVRANYITSWAGFFEMISILRNIIAHQGTIVPPDTLNELKSKAKDIFEEHFEISNDRNNEKHLLPKEKGFSNFMGYMYEFAAYTIKLTSGEDDLKFLNMY